MGLMADQTLQNKRLVNLKTQQQKLPKRTKRKKTNSSTSLRKKQFPLNNQNKHSIIVCSTSSVCVNGAPEGLQIVLSEKFITINTYLKDLKSITLAFPLQNKGEKSEIQSKQKNKYQYQNQKKKQIKRKSVKPKDSFLRSPSLIYLQPE